MTAMKWQATKQLGATLALILLTACGGTDSKTDDNPRGGGNTPHSAGPGLGTSKAMPEGPVFALPAGLSLGNPVLAYAPEDPVECDNKYPEREKANGSAVALCLAFHNNSQAPITLTLPPGLLFVSSSSQVQNGLLVQAVTIEVPAGARYVEPLFLHCANQDRNTSSLHDEYTLGPVVQYAAFQEFYALLTGKEIAPENIATIQFVVINLTRGEGLSNADRALLQAL